MTSNRMIQRRVSAYVRVACALLLAGCASAPGRYAFYGIQYATNSRSSNVEILDWQFGDHTYVDSNHQVLPRAPKSYVEKGMPINPQMMAGMLPVGDFLFVKWREKDSGAMHEQRADLSRKLPHDMNNYGVVWMADGPQLRVFLFPPLEVKDVLGHSSMTVGQAVPPSWGKTFLDIPWNSQHQIYP